MVWPIACRRLEEFPTINAMQLFEELCIQFPGRLTRKQYKTLARRVSLWRQAARARGVVIGPKAIVGSTTNRVVDAPISSRTIGQRWPCALKNVPIRPPLNFSSSSKPGTPDTTACDSFTRCRSESGLGANKPCSGSSARPAAQRYISLQIPHAGRVGNILDEADGSKIT